MIRTKYIFQGTCLSMVFPINSFPKSYYELSGFERQSMLNHLENVYLEIEDAINAPSGQKYDTWLWAHMYRGKLIEMNYSTSGINHLLGSDMHMDEQLLFWKIRTAEQNRIAVQTMLLEG